MSNGPIDAEGTDLQPLQALVAARFEGNVQSIHGLAHWRRVEQNALAIAQWLEQHPHVKQVIYPGLQSFSQKDLAARQLRQHNGQTLGGGMITVILDGELRHARTFLSTVRAFTLAESLGGVESLIEHPAIMTHASIPPEQRKAIGISDSLCRLSVGIEHVTDLQADLAHALEIAFA